MSTESGWEALDEAELELLKRDDLAESDDGTRGDDEAKAPSFLARLWHGTLSRFNLPKKPESERAPTYDDRYPSAPKWRSEIPSDDLAGLALSGGGIRSATFNLGLLQKLHEEGILKHFHYLSTVSGGGYVGGFWSAWRSKERSKKRPKEWPSGDGVFPTGTRPEPGEIRHLREFSNFLRPRLRLVSFETGRIVATLAGGVLPCVTVALAVIVLALLAWWGVHWALTAEASGGWLAQGLVPGLMLALLTLAVQVGLEFLWVSTAQEEPAARARSWYWTFAVCSSVLAGLTWWLLWHVALPPSLALTRLSPENLATGAVAVLPPATAWLGAVAALVAGRSLFSMRSHPLHGRFRQGALDRALARTFLCAVTWAVVGTLWLVGQLLAFGGVEAVLAAAGVGSASGGAFAWMRRFLTAQTNKPTGGKLRARAGPWLFQALAYLTLAAVTAATAGLLVVLYDTFGSRGLWSAFGTAAVVFLASFLFNPHEVGLHGFYRDRLVRAYLGASNLGPPPRATALCRHDDISLRCLPNKPLHLVCCAANDLSGDPLGTLHRGAESAVLSKLGFQVGDRWRRWALEGKAPTLGDAMTASAAAFNSHMGQVSMRLGQAATFLLTALGLRLGLWIENPAEGHPGGKKPWGHLFLRELLSWSRADARWIHLSDGAHYENLALYELVRRHCRFILLSDCGADPDRKFDDFGNAVRRVREDFGVEIRIDVSPLRPGADGKPRQHMVAGDIVYPPSEPNGVADRGVLLYVKPTLTGSEPPDVTQYARRNESFPHETTLDQFYDEAQWESYRRLGEHAAEQALASITRAGRELKDLPNLAPFFVSARYHWPPLPGEEPLLHELDAEWARLEKRLRKKELEPLRRELLQPEAAESRKTTTKGVSEDDRAAALPAVREAIRIMEAVYLRTGFGRDEKSPSHRRYMGWLNRVGVWASGQLFRYWWPWLEPFLTRDFVVFMHEHFSGLKETSFTYMAHEPDETDETQRKPRWEVRPLKGDESGYARQRWDRRLKTDKKAEAGKNRKADQGATGETRDQRQPKRQLYGFFLKPAGEEGPELNVGVVEVSKEGEAACWDAEDFYVAEGLWGLGIGEAFLGRLVKTLEAKGLKWARVHLEGKPSTSVDSLYAGAGFVRDPDPEHSGCFELDLTKAPG